MDIPTTIPQVRVSRYQVKSFFSIFENYTIQYNLLINSPKRGFQNQFTIS